MATARLPVVLVERFERHRPVDARAVHAAWRDRAVELGLDAGDVDEAERLTATLLGDPRRPLRRAQAAMLLDALEGAARRRMPRYLLVRDLERGPIIVSDPNAGTDNLAELLPDFRAAAADHRERYVLRAAETARADGEPRSWAQHGTRFSVPLRTLHRWRHRHGNPTDRAA